MKHYRPYRLHSSFIHIRVHIVAVCASRAEIAVAQTGSSVAATVSVVELNRKGAEAIDRKDYATALDCFRKTADQGDAVGQFWLGEIYLFGWGVTQSNSDAMTWHRKAAEQGNAAAQYRMAQYYKNSWGVPRDYSESVRWLRKAADQGNADGQTGLGSMYHEGLGVAQDYNQAFAWWLKAAGARQSASAKHRRLHVFRW